MTGFAHQHTLRVYFEDTDAGGMAYHANHLRWAERARTEALRDLGLPHQTMMDTHNSLLVVRRVSVEYAAAARLDDSLVVETRIVAVGAATLNLAQRVLRGTTSIATLDVGLACVDRGTLKPRRIPEPWRTALAARRFTAVAVRTTTGAAARTTTGAAARTTTGAAARTTTAAAVGTTTAPAVGNKGEWPWTAA